MSHFELHAHMKIRPGQLEGFKAQAAELIRITREQDTKTLRYDWFIKESGTECEVHEAYVNEEGLFQHNMHIMEAARQVAVEVAAANGVYLDPDRDIEFGNRSFDRPSDEWNIAWGSPPYNTVKVTGHRDNADPTAPDSPDLEDRPDRRSTRRAKSGRGC